MFQIHEIGFVKFSPLKHIDRIDGALQESEWLGAAKMS